MESSVSRAGVAEIEVVKRLFAAFAERDLDATLALVDPSIRFYAVTGKVVRDGRPYAGHAGMARYLEDVTELWDSLEIAGISFEAVTDAVVVLGEVHARGPAGALDEPIVWTWKFRDGLIVEGQVHGDANAARTALGLPPQAP